jgi:lipopolysaccharide transport system permease protein/teichoic acid transport system permease protein
MRKLIGNFFLELYRRRAVIFELARRDFQRQYQGSYLGFVWMFFQPLLFILVLFTVFTLGFRAGATIDVPFGVYLVSGIICWQYFSQNFSSMTRVIGEHSYLVKKVDFSLSILPIVKLLGSLLPHVFLLMVAIGLAWQQGFAPSLYTLQVIYYYFSSVALLLGVGWLTSSTSIFVKDVSKIVSVLVQFGFWLTPIFWNIAMVPEQYRWVIKLNPVFYLVSGYRDSLIYQTPFWQRPWETIYYWLFTLLFMYAGVHVYRKLRPHFAEVV